MLDKDRFNKIYKLGIDKSWSNAELPKIIRKTILETKKLIGKRPRVLDVGCGRGRLLKFLENNNFSCIYGIDISKKAIDSIEKIHNYCLKIADASEKIPFPNNYFDLVIEMTTISSSPPIYWRRILKEIHRVLKKNGYFISENHISRTKQPKLMNNITTNQGLDYVWGISKDGYKKLCKPYFKFISYNKSSDASQCQYLLFQK